MTPTKQDDALAALVDRAKYQVGNTGCYSLNSNDILVLEKALTSGAGGDELKERIVRAAQAVVIADTYKHPILSREDAVKEGVAELHDAVNAYAASMPPYLSPAAPKDEV